MSLLTQVFPVAYTGSLSQPQPLLLWPARSHGGPNLKNVTEKYFLHFLKGDRKCSLFWGWPLGSPHFCGVRGHLPREREDFIPKCPGPQRSGNAFGSCVFIFCAIATNFCMWVPEVMALHGHYWPLRGRRVRGSTWPWDCEVDRRFLPFVRTWERITFILLSESVCVCTIYLEKLRKGIFFMKMTSQTPLEPYVTFYRPWGRCQAGTHSYQHGSGWNFQDI